jgi:ATP-independent RNA helicase DbpA
MNKITTPTTETNNTITALDFKNLPLSPAVLANLQVLGYLQMTPIQAASLPVALLGKDVIAQAKTGSGKTAAFGLALLANLNHRRFAIQSLVLCPTRELADQIAIELRRLARSTDNIKIVTLCGGVPLRGQRSSLENGAHIAIGTPGRIMDHLARGYLDLCALNTLVLDEADRMLDMGFLEDIQTVAKKCPIERQTLLFSATYPDGIEKIAKQFMQNPQTIEVKPQKPSTLQAGDHTEAAHVEQRFYQVTRGNRLQSVGILLQHFQPTSSLLFCNTKAQCRDLVALLQAQGFAALALYGDLEQRERDQVLIQFANQSCSILVATDVASRGLDIAQLAAVINVDVTPDAEVHVHRMGRTGRAGEGGLVLNLASMEEMGFVGKIEQYQNQISNWHKLEGLTPNGQAGLVAPMVTLQLLGGRKEKIRAGDVLGALTSPSSSGEPTFTRDDIGKINTTDFSTFIAVKRELAQAALNKLNNSKVKGKSVSVRRL